MMYNNKLVASVKVGGKIMREDGETVYIPFGSEYSLLLKNLNTRKALVKVEIDGEEVTGGLLISPNQTVDFERYILDGNLDTGPKFKFIEKTEGISQHRGDRVEDGLVRVTYKFEKQWEPVYYTSNWYPPVYGSGVTNTFYNSTSVGSSLCSNPFDISKKTCDSAVCDTGITTKGSDSNQKFQYGSIGTLETTEYAIVLQLKGQIGQHVVQQPVTVRRRIRCDVCGKNNLIVNNKFCPECGTNLTDKW